MLQPLKILKIKHKKYTNFKNSPIYKRIKRTITLSNSNSYKKQNKIKPIKDFHQKLFFSFTKKKTLSNYQPQILSGSKIKNAPCYIVFVVVLLSNDDEG